MLMLINADEEGKKEFLAIEPGTHKSEQSWRWMLGQLAERGLDALRMAVADGTMGFWDALEKVVPESRQ